MVKHKSKVKVGITMGDPSGIGPAIIAKALSRLRGIAEFVVIGDEWVLKKVQSSSPAHLNLREEFQIPSFNIIDLKNVDHKKFEFGKVKAEYGRASIAYLEKALELIKNKEIDCLVTCPISKESLHKAGIAYSGHTEYLSERTGCKGLVMMLLNRHLRFSLVTRHIPLCRVAGELSRDKLYRTILVTHETLRQVFLIKNPKIVVCGLNPHASDNGVIGLEENKIIKPALRELRLRIKNLDGPISSDVAVARAYKGIYDSVIAIYHDQALIPLKLFRKNSGVNMTLGLPFVRTSPLHGTAFDIAKNSTLSDPRSLIEAIRLSIKCSLNLKKV